MQNIQKNTYSPRYKDTKNMYIPMLKNCVTFSKGEVKICHIIFHGCSKPNRNLQKMKILGNKKVVKLIGQWSLKNGTFMYHFFQ